MGESRWEFGGYEDVGELAPLSEPKYRDVQVVKKAPTRPADAPPLILTDLEPLRAHPKLTEVDLAWEVSVGDISAVASLPRLERLFLGEVSGDLAPLAKCAALRHLGLKGPRVTSLASLLPLAPQLESLDLTECALFSLDGVERFVRLERLSVSRSMVTRLPRLPTALRSLDLGHLAGLEDVSALSGCPKLGALWLGYSRGVKDLRPLAGLPLVDLELSGLVLLGEDDLAPLAGLRALQELSLADTNVRSLEVLLSLPELRSVALYGCSRLAHDEVLRVAPRLGKLETLHCDGDEKRTAALRRLLPRVAVNNHEPFGNG